MEVITKSIGKSKLLTTYRRLQFYQWIKTFVDNYLMLQICH